MGITVYEFLNMALDNNFNFIIYDFSKQTNIFDSQKDEVIPTEIEDMVVVSWNLNDDANKIELNQKKNKTKTQRNI